MALEVRGFWPDVTGFVVRAGHELRKLRVENQSRRLEPFGIFCNAQMTPRTLRRFCKLDGCSKLELANSAPVAIVLRT